MVNVMEVILNIDEVLKLMLFNCMVCLWLFLFLNRLIMMVRFIYSKNIMFIWFINGSLGNSSLKVRLNIVEFMVVIRLLLVVVFF